MANRIIVLSPYQERVAASANPRSWRDWLRLGKNPYGLRELGQSLVLSTEVGF
jgi:hypothetical protein